MSRTYRKNKGRDSLDKKDRGTWRDYRLTEDLDHKKEAGEEITHRWMVVDGEYVSVPRNEPYYWLTWAAVKEIHLSGKELKRAKAKARKDGSFTYGIGKYYKQKEWSIRRQFFAQEFSKLKKFEDYEVQYVNHNPDSSWDAW